MSYELKQSTGCARRLVELCHISVPTLLLISGGSSLQVMLEFSNIVDNTLNHLVIGFVDERFDFENSNYIQLLNQYPSAISRTKELGVTWIDTRPNKKDQYEMAAWYEQEITSIGYHRLIILLGMGTDGHIAGILPSEEQTFINRFLETNKIVVGYEANNVFPRRFTLTIPGLKLADTIVAYVTGEEKRAILTHALHDSPPLHTCPAAFFYQTTQLCEIYTDIEYYLPHV